METSQEQSDNLKNNLSENIQQLKSILNYCPDIVFREFRIGLNLKAIIVFINDLVDVKLIDESILKPLYQYGKSSNNLNVNGLKEILMNQIITAAQIEAGTTVNDITQQIFEGKSVLLVDGLSEAIFINIQKLPKRSIEEPVTEPAIRGPRDGFGEDLSTNISLVRRRIKTPDLKFEEMILGRITKTKTVLVYIQGIADEKIISEIRSRISKIDVDAILGSGYLEEFIEDSSSSLFPQISNTERPDKLVSSILEGQVGIMVDNTSFALIAPQTLVQMLQAPDDYYERHIAASFIRILRYFFYGIALTLPSFYIAFSTFHQGMIPTTLLYSMAAARANVPFPAVIEAFIMELTFEGLREAGIRLPKTVGQSVSIVGALVIGQAAVQAGIVSAPMVIIVSLTGIASFIFPKYNLALSIRILRFLMMILAGTLGLFGIFIGLLIIMIHMSNLRSFGIPYLAPLGPLNWSSLKDVFIRAPRWAMKNRPEFISEENTTRINNKNGVN